MNNELFSEPYLPFIIIATAITILVLLLKFFFKFFNLLWKSTLISYIAYVILIVLLYISRLWQMKSEHAPTFIFEKLYFILGPLLIVPGGMIYGLIPGVIKPCPSSLDFCIILIIGFLFYSVAIWGIMAVIKKSKESKSAEIKRGDNVGKQSPSDTDLKGV